MRTIFKFFNKIIRKVLFKFFEKRKCYNVIILLNEFFLQYLNTFSTTKKIHFSVYFDLHFMQENNIKRTK